MKNAFFTSINAFMRLIKALITMINAFFAQKTVQNDVRNALITMKNAFFTMIDASIDEEIQFQRLEP